MVDVRDDVREFIEARSDAAHARYAMNDWNMVSSIAVSLDLYEKHKDVGPNPEFFLETAEQNLKDYFARRLFPEDVQIGDGVTICLWSDMYAATIIKKTDRTVTVQRDKAILDPNFKPEWIPGGFAGHCTNQDEQTYTYERDPNGELYRFHWSDKHCTYGRPGNLRLIKGRHEFYDYNF